jgi:tetratricopeptide (TPR) repeat protein
LHQSQAIDPGFANSWELSARVYYDQVNLGLRPYDEGIMLAREAINQALVINADYAPAHDMQGWIATITDNDLVAAARHYEQALKMEPTNMGIYSNAAVFTAFLGRIDDAVRITEYLVSHDPVNPYRHKSLSVWYLATGHPNESIASSKIALLLSPGIAGANCLIGRALLIKGEPQAALEAIQSETSDLWRLICLPLAFHSLGQADESDVALAALIEQQRHASYAIAYVYAWRGETDKAFEWLAIAVEDQNFGLAQIAFQPLFSNIHDDPRWLPFLESIGKSPEQLAAIKFNVTLPE